MSALLALKEHVADLDPVVTKLVAGTGAARDAFNRHSRSSMEEMQNLSRTAAQEIEAALKKLEGEKAQAAAAEFQRLSGIYKHLQIMSQSMGALADPIQKKIKDGVLFSDKAVAQTNYLFDTQAGLLRSVLDIFKTDNEFLKIYTESEARNLIQTCSNFATEHETRLIEGLCQPQAAPLFLAILENIRIMGQQERDIVKLLA